MPPRRNRFKRHLKDLEDRKENLWEHSESLSKRLQAPGIFEKCSRHALKRLKRT